MTLVHVIQVRGLPTFGYRVNYPLITAAGKEYDEATNSGGLSGSLQ